MEQEGRRPSYDNEGQIRGYRSRPGAPTAQSGMFGTTSLTSGSGATPQDAWDKFFNKGAGNDSASPAQPAPVNATPAPIAVPPSNIALAPETPPDATSMAKTLPRPYTAPRVTADSLYQQAGASHDDFMRKMWYSPPQKLGVAESIALKYGGAKALQDTMNTRAWNSGEFARKVWQSPKLDRAFDSLLS
jgi:hypothetical protein